MQEHVDYIEAVAIFSERYLKEATSTPPPKEMRKVVGLLYDAMLKLDFGTPAQDAIARLCEAWYASKMEECDEVGLPAVIVMYVFSGHQFLSGSDLSTALAVQTCTYMLFMYSNESSVADRSGNHRVSSYQICA